MSDKELIQSEIAAHHTNVGRVVLKTDFKNDSSGKLESVSLRCRDAYVTFTRSNGGDFVARCLCWLRKGAK